MTKATKAKELTDLYVGIDLGTSGCRAIAIDGHCQLGLAASVGGIEIDVATGLFEMLDQVIPGAEPEAAKALAREMKKKMMWRASNTAELFFSRVYDDPAGDADANGEPVPDLVETLTGVEVTRANGARGLVVVDYVRAQAQDVHALGKLMMANGAPTRLCWLVPWLDVMGTRYGADIDSISLERAGSPGLVNARLNLQIPKS